MLQLQRLLFYCNQAWDGKERSNFHYTARHPVHDSINYMRSQSVRFVRILPSDKVAIPDRYIVHSTCTYIMSRHVIIGTGHGLLDRSSANAK